MSFCVVNEVINDFKSESLGKMLNACWYFSIASAYFFLRTKSLASLLSCSKSDDNLS